MRIAWDLFTARKDGFDRAQRDGCDAPFVSVDGAGDDVIDHFGELVDLRIAFGFPHFLNDNLFGGLRTNATDDFFVI